MTPFSQFNLFSLAGGLALFLYGMQQGEINIRRIGGSQLRNIIGIITRHRIFAFSAGLLVTLLTQSSSATTVILVGLVNARVMMLGQSLGMILGSDLGTTLTVQLFAFKFYQIAPLLIAVGLFSSLHRKSPSVANTGRLLFATGLIFYGMHLMADAVGPLRSYPPFERVLHASLVNPWYGLLAGTIITAVIQSSAATLTIVIALVQSASTTPLSVTELFPIIMGANLGTCITAFLSTFGSGISGTRVAWSHFFFKLFGIALFFPLLPVINFLSPLLPGEPALRIAMLHTVFNVCIGIVFLPLLHPFERFIERMIRSRPKQSEAFQTEYLSDAVITLPVLALAQAVKEIGRMGDKISAMVRGSIDLIHSYSSVNKELLVRADNEVDFLHEQLVSFLTRMSRQELDADSAAHAYQLIMITTDLEHIGDSVSKSVVKLAEKIDASPLPLSEEGKEEIIGFYRQTTADLIEVLAAFTMNNTDLALTVFNRKQERDAHYDQLFGHHMDRLFNRKPESLQTTSIHIDLLEEIRRIDHFVFRVSAHILKIHNAE
ncbi:MAG: Na/Pi cotransporter family protein [Chitinispirillaceae bacterium]|nr:Na/Pi cotransporter family protein [Chitinispirillaceae bacterium]